jgi:hypothetical protein
MLRFNRWTRFASAALVLVTKGGLARVYRG